MADKHDELSLGMGKQCLLKASDVLIGRKGYYIYAITDTVLASVTTVTEAAAAGETITGTITGLTLSAGSQFPITITDLTVTSGTCIIYLRD
tara:strand:- start:962 stop:1237 length:276 start_codon:yes stop_codon:yes gene_type:complete